MSYRIAVRELCEFAAKSGDLDLRFTPSPTAQEGIAAHGLAAARRGAHYQAELALSGSFQELQVRGRADGFDARTNRLDEVKTHRGDLGKQPINHRALHWAQAKVYGHLLCEALQLRDVSLALVYVDIGSQRETVFEQAMRADDLRAHFEALCERFLQWARQELAHRAARDAALTELAFPLAAFRAGQRELATAVYRAAAGHQCLMAQAPTGIGKTLGTIFPLLKACPTQQLDKVFYLAAKTPGRALALDALAVIRDKAPDLPLRVIELVARDKACEYPDRACHGESCPLAQGFYDRLPAARQAAAGHARLDKASLRQIAAQHQVCPYYLAQEMVRWCDVAVGDYNYFFDAGALLHGMTAANDWRVGVLVDEAHNLVERARKMYSATINGGEIARVQRTAPAALKKSFARVKRHWKVLNAALVDDYAMIDTPDQLLGALQGLAADITDYLAEQPAAIDPDLQRFYFDALAFGRLAESVDTHSLFDLTREAGGHASLCLRNLVPAPFLSPRFAAAHTVTLFSATLAPWAYTRDLLGLPNDVQCIDLPSPFSSAQLTVRVARHISTRYADRAASLMPIADLLARQFAAQPGNYLAFFSSFDYLQQAAQCVLQRHPHIPIWEQSRGMDEASRDAFLARFTNGGQGIGFAVLGGPFAEGIDLPGARLIGAFIATLGLPQINPVNEQLRSRMHEMFGAGYDYAYLYPGLQKVVQAAGRVVRTLSDRGTVILIDDRFARPQVCRLLPKWWQLEH